ncbi:hypothetical protein JIY74_24690 [Vibrio harveyi]|nr:hypothetical protein [Vibrio harveyi]
MSLMFKNAKAFNQSLNN